MAANLNRRILLTDATLPPLYANKTSDSYVNESHFDTNMVIILAALLCALICALGLNSIVRCAIRCSHRFSFPDDQLAVAAAAAKGLKKRELKQIPVGVYGGDEVEIVATECAICLGEFVDGEKVRVLPKCKHGFHVRCIDMWLVEHSSCPNCRHSLLEKKSTKEVAVEEEEEGRRRSNGLGLESNVSVVIDGPT